MIEHVRRRVVLCPLFSKVIVATCDREIFDIVCASGGQAVMTSNSHERCTDRIAEAAESIDADIIINIQGDEPLVRPDVFKPLIEPLINEPEIGCSNLMSEIETEDEFKNHNVIKTVCDLHGYAIYYSREPIPSISKTGNLIYKKYKQLGVIAFRKDFLSCFTSLHQTPLEKIESVDMLRAIEHGYKIKMVLGNYRSIGVDTPEDLEKAITLMETDDLFSIYREELL